MPAIKSLALQCVGLAHGLACFGALGLRAVWDGYIVKRPSSKFWTAVEKAREDYWSLSKNPDGLNHAFHTLRNGLTLHYVTASRGHKSSPSSNLVIFLHGWPDSWMLWRSTMSKTMAKTANTRFVALDLPGHGGSDALRTHNATQVLEAVTEFILAMREQYTDAEKDPRVLVVAHDWGALIGFKLAAQAAPLADRYILINSILPELASDNIARRWKFATEMLPKWLGEPKRLSLLRSIKTTLAPVVTQIVKSSYVFIFNLPKPLPHVFGNLGNMWFIRYAHFLASGGMNAPDGPEAAIHMASSLGPSASCCSSSTVNGSQGYGLTVMERAPHGAWANSIRYYSEGLTTQRWEKSLETMAALHNLRSKSRRSSSGAGIFEDKPGQLRAPTTVLWGEKDPALSSTIMTEGIKDYFVFESQVITLPKLGHWVPVEEGGAEVIADVVAWALDLDKGSLEDRLQGLETDFKVTVTK